MPLSFVHRQYDTTTMMLLSNNNNNNSVVVDDDNVSISSSSSFDVETYLRPQKIARVAGQKSQRRVAFNEQANEYHENPHLGFTKDDTKALWCDNAEYKLWKAQHTDNAREVIRAELEHASVEGSFLYCLDQLYSDSCRQQQALPETHRQTQLVHALSVDRVGLEKISTRCLRLDKKQRRKELVDAVLDVQQQQPQGDDAMAQASLHYSRVSTEIAHRLAVAQYECSLL